MNLIYNHSVTETSHGRLIFLLLIFLLPQILLGQNLKFKTLRAEDGLSNNSINGLANDPSGAIWIGTWDGLNYYDGNKFRVFKHIPGDTSSLAGNYVNKLVTDRHKNLWVHSHPRYISRHDGEGKFTNYKFDNEIAEMGVATDGSLVVTAGQSNYRFDNDRFSLCSLCTPASSINPSLANILLAKYPAVQIQDIWKDKKGNIWYATIKNGLFIIPSNSENITNEVIDHYEYDPADPYSLKSNEVIDILEDHFGNIWLGLKDGGLSMAYKNSNEISFIYPHPTKYPHLPNETIRAITQDNESRLWIGFYNSGTYRFDFETMDFVKFEIPRAKENPDWYRTRSLYTDSYGQVWIGTYGGVVKYKDNYVTYYDANREALMPNNRNYSFYEDRSSQTLWVACWGGVAKFDMAKNSFVEFEGQSLLNDFHVRDVAFKNDSLWVATETNGVLVLYKGQLSKIDQGSGLLDNSVYSLWIDDATDNTWIATHGGIIVYHPGKGIIASITEKQGLLSQLVYGVLPDDRHIWVSTTKGIAAIDRETFEVLAHDPQEGWQATEFSEGAYYQNAKGMLFFGGVKGLNFFHPQKLDLTQEIPNLSIENVQRHDEGITLNVTPIAFSRNPNNKCLYRLDPYESSWKELDPNHTIEYSDLGPGAYRLLVKNSLDPDPGHIKEIAFSLPKPFWQTSGFIASSVLLLLGLVIFWKHQSSRYLQKELEAKILERTKVIEQQKIDLQKVNDALEKKSRDELAQKEQLLALHNRHKNVDFEIEKCTLFIVNQVRTPLAELQEEIEAAGFKTRAEKEKVFDKLNKVVGDLKDWENKSLFDYLESPRNSITNLLPLFESLVDQLQTSVKKADANLVYDFQLTQDWVEVDVLRLKLLLQCIFKEIVKFLEPHSGITISARSTHNSVEVALTLESDVFSSNIDNIKKYSPYIRSSITLLDGLKGQICFSKGDKNATITVDVPITMAEKEKVTRSMQHWMHSDLKEKLDPEKHNIIILSQKFESDNIFQIIRHHKFNTVIEHDVSMVISALRHVEASAILIHNERLTQNIITLLDYVRENCRSGVPVIYIGEFIDYSFQEKLIDAGVDLFIQLPSTNAYIYKMIENQIKIRKAKLEEKPILALLRDENPVNYVTPNEKLVKQAIDVINKELSNPAFKVESLSESLGISQIKCYRIFKEVLNTSPSDLIIGLKLQKAEKLLRERKLNVSEVSFECGFNDPKYFSKLFKKRHGISPKEFQLTPPNSPQPV